MYRYLRSLVFFEEKEISVQNENKLNYCWIWFFYLFSIILLQIRTKVKIYNNSITFVFSHFFPQQA